MVLSRKPWDAHLWGQLVLCAQGFAKQLWFRETASGVYVASGFLGGPRDASVAEKLSTEEAADVLVAQIADVLEGGATAPNTPPLRWVDAVKVDWGKDPWAVGGYSSPTVDAHDAWRDLLDSGSARLWYAGEAAHHNGSTVSSAVESGRRAAAALAGSLKRGSCRNRQAASEKTEELAS